MTINPAALTLSTSNITKTYDGTTSALGTPFVTSGTLYGSDSLSGGTFAFTDKNAGTNKTVTVSGVTLNDGNSGNNYTVTYANNTASTINKADLTLNPLSANRIYGQANSTIIYDFSANGLIGSETKSVVSGLSYTTNALLNSPAAANAYSITASGGTASNYNIIYGAANGTNLLSITKASLTITADSASRYMGLPNPPFAVSYSGFAGGDGPNLLGGSLFFTTPANQSSSPGDYVITPSGLSSGNYNLTYVDGTLHILKSDGVIVPGAPANGYAATLANAQNSTGGNTYNLGYNLLESKKSTGVDYKELFIIVDGGVKLPSSLIIH